MNIQKRIDSLQPYVAQIRFVNGMTVVDVFFKEGWKVPTSKVVEAAKGEDDDRYYMFYSEREDVTLDDILDYIEQVININIEREKKYELLKVKTEELKELFKKNSLSKLQNMKFVLGGEKLVPDAMPADFDDDITMDDIDDEPEMEAPIEEEVDMSGASNVKAEMTETGVKAKVGNQDIELPPKGEKIELTEYEEPTVVCKCGPDDVCPACVDEKMEA